MTDLNAAIRSAIEDAAKDEAKSRFDNLIGNLSGKTTPERDCYGIFKNGLILLRDAREKALKIADEVFPPPAK